MGAVLQLADLRRLGWGPALVPIAPGSKRPGVSRADAIGWQSKQWAPEPAVIMIQNRTARTTTIRKWKV